MKFIYPIFLLCVFGVLNMSLYSSGPPLGVTGGGGEKTCSTTAGCHRNGTFSGTVLITGLPDTVVANASYTVILSSSSTNAVRGGFQVTCLDGTNLKSGTLIGGAGSSVASGNDREYVQQTAPKIYAGGIVTWTFTWKAPATSANPTITFYAASLLANGDGDNTGDVAITGTKKIFFKSSLSPTTDLISDAEIIIAPNPTSQILWVHLQRNDLTTRLSIIDLTGKIVLQQNVSDNSSIRVSDLVRGIYFARFMVGNQTVVKKFELN